ncbi:hypothetical protein RND81_12G112900 [Saponaria officinalis]|uniref:DNA-directed RNA polymerase III subunit RPC3 n=1 Tax=Saponaria officinalis TaxID=3572 RepID=A0AAW1H9B9_SAPOF
MSSSIKPPSQHGIKLAVNIISTDFGQLVAKVCECLLRRGNLTKAQISKFSEVPHDKVTKCLWVLIQHNCVQAFALEQQGGGRDTTVVVTQYMALFNNIIQRLRFAKFLLEVSKELDKEAQGILGGLLQHGRLTLPQILDRAMETSDKGNDVSRETYNESFITLLRNRFVERCPAAEPFIPLPTDEETKQSRPKARKFARREVTLEERALAAAIPMDGERFSISNEHDVNSDEDKMDGNVPSAKVGEKRTQDSLEKSAELDLLGPKGEPIWRVNFEEFINRLRKKACVEYARTVYDNTAGVILTSMLKRTKSTDNKVSMSLDSIFEEVVKSEEGSALNSEQVRCSLEQLHFCSEEDDVFTINLKDIIEKTRLEEVESLILKRYGHDAFRIFRSLSSGRALHTDQVSEKTLTDKKDTPQILYKLWQDGFLHMEKISSGGGLKPTDYLYWSIKMDKIWPKVLDELHHAALNLSLRCVHEIEKNHEVNNMSKGDGKVLSQEADRRIRRRQQVYIALNSSLMQLDDAIMFFTDFLV